MEIVDDDSNSQESPSTFSRRYSFLDNDELDFPRTRLSDLYSPSPASPATRQSPGSSPVHLISDDETNIQLAGVRTQTPDENIESKYDFTHPRKRKDSQDFSKSHVQKRPLVNEDISPPVDLKSLEKLSAFASSTHTISDSESSVSEAEGSIEHSLPVSSISVPLKKDDGITKEASKRKERKNNKAVTNENRLIKLQEKANKAQLADQLRRIKPGNSIKFVTTILDTCITTSAWGLMFIESLSTAEFKHKIESLPADNCITWDLNSLDSEITEKHVLLIWNADQIITSVKFGILIETFDEIKSKFLGHKVHLAILNLQEAYRRIKRNQNRRSKEKFNRNAGSSQSDAIVTIEDIEMKLCELLVLSGVSSRPVSDKSVVQFIHKMTQTVSERPYKIRRGKKDREFSYFARGDSKKCVRVDKDFNGLTQLWLQQLSQVTSSTLDVAKAIVTAYPTPMVLSKAYDACCTESEKELLLQDLTIRRGWGPGATTRNLGPKMSRKIFVLFRTTDGSATLRKE